MYKWTDLNAKSGKAVEIPEGIGWYHQRMSLLRC